MKQSSSTDNMIFFIYLASTETHLGLSIICDLWLLNKNSIQLNWNQACLTCLPCLSCKPISPHNGKLLSFFPFLRLPSLPLHPTLDLSQSLLSYRGYLSDLLFTPSSILPSLLHPWLTSSLISMLSDRPVPPPLL